MYDAIYVRKIGPTGNFMERHPTLTAMGALLGISTIVALGAAWGISTIEERLRPRRELHQEFNQVIDTNNERMRVYDHFGLEIPLPNLTTEQKRQYLANHRQDGEQ